MYRLKAYPTQFELISTDKTDGDRPIWILDTEIEWSFYNDYDLLYNGKCPRGMTTDLGSIPRFLSSIVNGNDEWNIAYKIHDYMCQQKILTSDLAAECLYTACEKFGCPSWKAYTIYFCVKHFGPKWSN